MKTYRSLLIVLLWMVCSAITQAQDPDFHIYLAFGQSNMEGAGAIESQDKVGVDERFKVIGALDCTGDHTHQPGKWTTAIPPLVRCRTGLGVLDYFGRTLVQDLPSGIKIGIVPVAVGGSDIVLFDKVNYASYVKSAPSWMKDIINSYGGNPYGRLVEVAKLAQKEGVIKGIIFHQGETNTNNPEWKNKVADVVRNLKTDLQLGDVPFLAGELLASTGACCGSHNVEVNKLPSLIPNAHVISSADLVGADAAHFTSASYREFGKRYAKKMIEVLGLNGGSWQQTATASVAQQKQVKRERLPMDHDWHFAFGHPYDVHKDFGTGTAYFSYLAKAGNGDGAAAAGFDDRAWRVLDLPHDWAVEQQFSPNASFSHGFKAIGRAFPERSVGWYRKTFTIPTADLGKRLSIVFDGVFRNSIVWVNGHYLGTEQSGYSSFRYDITDVLNYGGDNVIAVRVDATMEEGWYYEGAGIYRHVWLTKTAPVHVAANGTFVTSQIQGLNTAVSVKTEVMNEAKESKTIEVIQTIVDADGKVITTKTNTAVSLAPFQTREITTDLSVNQAKLWDIDAPNLYKLVTRIREKGDTIDQYETPFGIRTIRFDASAGFFLNGKPVKLKGTNNHQDHAGVGDAMPDELQYWRIKTLKDMGANAYRCSHHPPTPELLDACDRLGMLVLDENRLMRTTADGLNELKRMIMRDRNHPSVIGWSVGNEEWAIENNITGERIAATLQAFANSLDSTRPATAGVSGGFRSGISDVLQVMGYNYLGNGDIDAHRKRFPTQPGMGTEEGSTFAARGIYITDDKKHYQAAYDRKPRPTFYSIEEGWKFYAERPYLAGMFIWTGFDYRGEPTPYGWPSVTSYFGMLDLCGFPKDNAYYLRSWWGKEPVLHLLPHWNWKGQEGKMIDVWAYSNCDEVELFLNKKSLGRKKMTINGHLEWKVAYAPGKLEAVGYKGGKKLLTDIVRTSAEPASIRLSPHKTSLTPGCDDIAIVTVQAPDKNNLAVPTADNEITFTIQGPGKIIGVGNGDPTSLENDRFIETIETISIENLKEKAVDSMGVTNETGMEVNDTNWKEAFKDRDYKNLAKAYVYRGSFMLPQNYASSAITLFYKNIGREQSIYINGKEIAHSRKQNETAAGYLLNKSLLQPGKNVIAIVATPIPKQHEWENVNTDPGLIQLVVPAGTWKRKLFNGLAQVIIQTTTEAGDIVLTATSPNLEPATLRLVQEPPADHLLP